MSDVPEIPKEIEELADELSGGWWNYRIVEKSNSWIGPDGNRHLERYYELHEVYYNGKGEIWSWTENPVGIYFESYEEMKQILKQYKKACKHPILKFEKHGIEETLVETGEYLYKLKGGKHGK